MMNRRCIIWSVLASAVLVLGSAAPKIRADEPREPASQPAPTQQLVRQAIADLDADDFEVRRRAWSELSGWADRKELAALLSAELDQALARPAGSLDARSKLTALRELLPRVVADDRQPLGEAEAVQLVRRLQSSFSVERTWAQQQVMAALARPGGSYLIMRSLHAALADPNMPAGVRRELLPMWRQARGAWAASDPATWSLPPASVDQIARLLDDVSAPAGTGQAAEIRATAAADELVEIMCRDDYVEKVRAAVSARLEATTSPVVRERLQELFDWTRPAMAAEVWADGNHETIQYLLVGVPQFPEGGFRASHFDPVDEKTAHCVSGNNLLPGEDYPMGVAIPFPGPLINHSGGIFHLVYLPTPRRRIVYDYELLLPPGERLARISRRTVDAILAEKRRLYAPDLVMLQQLDRRAVSQFAGPYFQALDDGPIESAPGIPLGGATMFGSMCRLLTNMGTREAAAGIEEAIVDGRLAKGAAADGALALLAILSRDKSQEADVRLARLVERTEVLTLDLVPPPELGATAAAMLLARRGVRPGTYGLAQTATTQDEESVGVIPHRFESPSRRADVLKWWKSQRQ